MAGDLILVAGLAALVRFFRLDHWGFWFDEAHSIALAANPSPATVVAKGVVDQQAPLFFILLHFWLKLGESDYFLRTLPALVGVGTVLAVYWLGCELGGRPTGRLAGILAALSSYLVYYSGYLRGYILVALAFGVGAAALFRAARTNRPGWWAVYVAAGVVAVYTHQFGLFGLLGLAAAGLLLIFARPAGRRAALAGWAGAQLALLAACVPWLAVLWEQFGRVQAGLDAWIEPVGPAAWKTLYDWLWFRTRAEYGLPVDTGLRVVRYGATALLAGFLVRAVVRREWRPAAAALLLGVPPAAAFAVSLVGRPVWDPRFMVFTAVPFSVVLAAAVGSLPVRAGRLGLGLSLGLALVPPLGSYYFDPTFANPEIREAAAWLAQHRQPGEPVLHPNEQSFLPALFYNRRLVSNSGPGFRVFCPWSTPPAEWCERSPTADYWVGGLDSPLPVDKFLAESGAARAFVVVLYNRHRAGEREEFAERLNRGLPAGYRARPVAAFLGVDIYAVTPGPRGRFELRSGIGPPGGCRPGPA